MRIVSVLAFAGLFVLSAFTPASVLADQHGDHEGPSNGDESDGAPNGQGAPDNETEDAPTDHSSDPSTPSNSSASDARNARECRQRYADNDTMVAEDDPCHWYYARAQQYEDEREDHEEAQRLEQERRRQAYEQSVDDSDDEEDARQAQEEWIEEQRRRALATYRDKLSGFAASPTGLQGTYVSLLPVPTDAAFYDIQVEGITILSALHTPEGYHGAASLVHGNTIEARGDDWRLRIVDQPAMTTTLRSDDGPFTIHFPDGAQVRTYDAGATITVPAPGGGSRVALLAGDIEPFGSDGNSFLVEEARLRLVAENPVAPRAAQAVGAHVDSAMLDGRVGAEMSIVRGQDGVVNDTATYEDMEVQLAEGSVDGQAPDDGTYTITVDSANHTGKTIVVYLEEGILDPDNMVVRYFNVDNNTTVEATIVQASSLADVLDPLDDGVIAEWYAVTSAEGDAILISFPHFSIHQVELQSIGEVIIEQPSLVLGVVGAVVLVGAATAGMFRRPQE